MKKTLCRALKAVVVMLALPGVALLPAAGAQAQDNGYTISVKLSGNRPRIEDFVNALLNQEDAGEAYGPISADWKLWQKGRPLPAGHELEVAPKNGYARHEVSYPDGGVSTTEFCYWNIADGSRLVLENRSVHIGDLAVETELTGVTFYRYNPKTRKLTLSDPSSEGVEFPTYPTGAVTFHLPREGKDITADYTDQEGRVHEVVFKWNGNGFNLQPERVRGAGKPAHSAGAGKASAGEKELRARVEGMYALALKSQDNYKRLERDYTTRDWRELLSAVRYHDSQLEGEIGFFDHDYWLMAQDNVTDLKVQNFKVEIFEPERELAQVRFDLVRWGSAVPLRMILRLQDGTWRLDNLINLDKALGPGGFDYVQNMKEYLTSDAEEEAPQW